jgi:hypothetical protein
MDADMTGDVISLDSLGVAVCPGAGQTEIIGRFAADVFVA